MILHRCTRKPTPTGWKQTDVYEGSYAVVVDYAEGDVNAHVRQFKFGKLVGQFDMPVSEVVPPCHRPTHRTRTRMD